MLRGFFIVVLAACSLMCFLNETDARQDGVRPSTTQMRQPLAMVHDDQSGLQFTPMPDSLPDDSDELEHASFDDHSHEGDKLLPVPTLQWDLRNTASWVSFYLVATKTAPVFAFERPPKPLSA